MKKKFSKNITIAVVMVFLLLILSISLIYLLFFFPVNSIDKNTKLGELNLSHLSVDEAKEKIDKRVDNFKDQGLVFIYNNEEIKIPSRVIAFDSEMSYEIFSIDKEKSLENVINTQTNNLFLKLFPKLQKQQEKIIKADYRFHKERFSQTLEKQFTNFKIEAENAYYKLNDDQEINIIPEIIGIKLDTKNNLNLAKNNLDNLSLNEIQLKTKEIKPEILSSDLTNKKDLVLEILEENDFILSFNNENFDIDKKDVVEWIMIKNQEVFLDEDKISDYLKFNIAPKIDRLAKMPEFTIEDEKVKDWQPGTSGRRLLIEENTQLIANNLLKEEENINLKVEEIFYDEAEGIVSEIREIIGTGHSNFAGSPYNRVHNIRLGADVYHGIIIEPGQEFSTLEHLGPVNRETGYLPELVIKDGQTIPEYGGGLCQISTTLFRTALEAGLPITQRQPHSYRVSYYEPAGTDASIYNPWPDLKFKNDTDYHILIQARIEGANIYFDLWSTNDGREVILTDPVIYNITPPPPTKYIESDDLQPNEKKCTERAINGANTHFDYTVIYPDGEKVEKRFYSYYVPWQEVCLVGKELKEEIEEEIENEDEEE